MKNNYCFREDYVIIFCNSELITIIDQDDFEKVNSIKKTWSCRKDSSGYYYCMTNNPHQQIHRLIMNAKEGEIIDHINYNTLDNRKSNLRITDKSGNAMNRRGLNKNNTSGFRGVSRQGDGWMVRKTVNGKRVYVGYCYTLEEVKKKLEMFGT